MTEARIILASACLALSLGGPAHAQEPALGWVPLQGAQGCIGPLELARRVEERLGHAALQAPARATRSIEGHVQALDGGGFRATVEVYDRDDGLGTRHVLHSPAPDCRAMDGALSLLVALAIDSEAMLPALIADGSLSREAHELLRMLGLPSDDTDAALALLAPMRGVQRAAAPTGAAPASRSTTSGRRQRATPLPRPGMVLVSSSELQRLRRLERIAPEPEAPTPRWPGYLMLAGGSVLTVGAIWTGVVDDEVSAPQLVLGAGAFAGIAGFLVWHFAVADEERPEGRRITWSPAIAPGAWQLQLRGQL